MNFEISTTPVWSPAEAFLSQLDRQPLVDDRRSLRVGWQDRPRLLAAAGRSGKRHAFVCEGLGPRRVVAFVEVDDQQVILSECKLRGDDRRPVLQERVRTGQAAWPAVHARSAVTVVTQAPRDQIVFAVVEIDWRSVASLFRFTTFYSQSGESMIEWKHMNGLCHVAYWSPSGTAALGVSAN